MKNQESKTKKVRRNITLSPELLEKLDNLKESSNIDWDNLVSYMFDLQNFRVEPKGVVLAEITLKKWLAFGHETKITVTELRKWTGVRAESCKSVFDAYNAEIEVFNNQFNNK